MGFNIALRENFERYKNIKLYSIENNNLDNAIIYRLHYFGEKTLIDDDKITIKNFIKDYFKVEGKEIFIKLKKYYSDETLIKNLTLNYLKENYISIASTLEIDKIICEKKTIDNENIVFEVVINLLSGQLDYLENAKVVEKTENYLNDVLFDNVVIKLKKEEANASNILETQKEKMENIYSAQFANNKLVNYEVNTMTHIAGEKISGVATLISSIKEPIEKCSVAGIVSYFNENTYKSKKKDKNGNDIFKKYFTFEICDLSHGTIRVIVFPRITDYENMLKIQNDATIIVNGEVSKNGDNFELSGKSLYFCSIPDIKFDNDGKYKNCPQNYINIKPEEYKTLMQTNLFSNEELKNPFLIDNDFVVFDLETTGIEYSTNEITEIGAVKIKNGKIAESFTTLVKPKNKIPPEITKITGINDSMVKDKLSISEIIPDFYKFCDKCILVAYNIDFDYKFLNSASTAIGYKFKNRQIDALYLARIYIPGLKHYRLKDVVEKLNVTLDGAHRALNDAVATAKVFLILGEKIEK